MTLTFSPPQPGDQLPRAPAPAAPSNGGRTHMPWKRIAVAIASVVVGLVVVLFVFERAVTKLMYDQRQRHLAAEFERPATDAIVRDGQPIAVIQSTTIELNSIVVEGNTTEHLRGGPARSSASALPGEIGRTVISGHRTAYGGPFARIDELVAGDTVVVQTRNGGPIVAYIVRDVLVDADEDDLDSPAAGIAELVLVTSRKGWLNDERIVVVASTLPVIDDHSGRRDVDLAVSDWGPSFALDALIANAAAAAAVMVWLALRQRVRRTLAVAVVAPPGLFAVASFLLLLDAVLPATR